MKQFDNKHRISAVLMASVSLLTFAVYMPALRNGFVNWDDHIYVVHNLKIRSLDGGFFKWAFSDILTTGNWHPLTWISHALDYALWGLNPFGHHLTGLLLHALNTALVVYLSIIIFEAAQSARKYSPTPGIDDRLVLTAAGLSGLLFGLHPLRVESVGWVSERKDLLCAFFFLLSIAAYAKYAHRPGKIKSMAENAQPGSSAPGTRAFAGNRRYYLLALIFFASALMSKPMAVSLPLVFLILDWYPFGRIESAKDFYAAFIEKLPFIVFSLAMSTLALISQKSAGAMAMMEVVPLYERALVAAQSLIMYLWKMLLPVRLVPFYPFPERISLLSIEIFPAVFLVVGTTAASLYLLKRCRFLAAAWIYYVVTLLPVIGIIKVGGQAMADRFTYLPGLAPTLLAGIAGAWLWEKSAHSTKVKSVRPALIVAAMFLFVFMANATMKQTGIWKDSLELWGYIIEQEPARVPFAYNYRGMEHKEMGLLDRAMEDYNKAIALRPEFDQTYVNRGILFATTGRIDEAVGDFTKALSLNPQYVNAYISRGLVLQEVGLLEQAKEDLDRAIALDPVSDDAYLNRGVVFERMGHNDRAMDDYSKTIELNPFNDLAFSNRALMFMRADRIEKALEDLQKACGLGNRGACDEVRRYATR